jgi:hypothetical protein
MDFVREVLTIAPILFRTEIGVGKLEVVEETAETDLERSFKGDLEIRPSCPQLLGIASRISWTFMY